MSLNNDILAASRDYLRTGVLESPAACASPPGPGRSELLCDRLSARRAGLAPDVESVHTQIRTACAADADGALITGSGLRRVSIVEALVQDLSRSVVTANEANL